MKTTLAIVLCVVAFAAVCSAEEKYTTKFDNINVDQILANERLLKPYLNCLLKDLNCTPDARELKRLLPDALATNCEKCSEKQKIGAEKVISHLATKKPDVWREVLAKYDKDDVYRTKYASDAARLGVPLP